MHAELSQTGGSLRILLGIAAVIRNVVVQIRGIAGMGGGEADSGLARTTAAARFGLGAMGTEGVP